MRNFEKFCREKPTKALHMIFGYVIDICHSIQRTANRENEDIIQGYVWMKVDEPYIFCMFIDLKYFHCYMDL